MKKIKLISLVQIIFIIVTSCSNNQSGANIKPQDYFVGEWEPLEHCTNDAIINNFIIIRKDNFLSLTGKAYAERWKIKEENAIVEKSDKGYSIKNIKEPFIDYNYNENDFIINYTIEYIPESDVLRVYYEKSGGKKGNKVWDSGDCIYKRKK